MQKQNYFIANKLGYNTIPDHKILQGAPPNPPPRQKKTNY